MAPELNLVSARGSEPRSSRGMAATSQPLATQVAVDVLADGGSAVDAALAANAVLGVVEPTGCGIGGDLFALVWDPDTSSIHGLNASGRSPGSLTLEKMKTLLPDQSEIPITGALGITVPGCVDGWFELHSRFGRLEMDRILGPAISAASNGFEVTPVIAGEWARDVARIQKEAHRLPESREFFDTYAPRGAAPRSGERHTNSALATTLDWIARKGRNGYYEGVLAREIAHSVIQAGGFLSEEDLAGHQSRWVEPISIDYRGFDVLELPSNNQGLTVLQMLALVEPYDLVRSGFGSVDTLHLLIECKKLAFEDRARIIADPDFAPYHPELLLSESRLERQRHRINPDKALLLEAAALALHDRGDTCYLTTADRNGMMVSLIQSNFRKLGSGVVPNGLGFCLQNRGALFSLDSGHPNVFQPLKRPFHTIIPAFLMKNGRPLVSFGVMGGAMQPQGQVQILTDLIDFGMSLQQAGDAPRWRHVGSTRPTGVQPGGKGVVLVESGFSDVMKGLANKGHAVELRTEDDLYGGYQAIAIDPVSGDYVGASEMRKDGMAIGL